jgi:hypothetical protein
MAGFTRSPFLDGHTCKSVPEGIYILLLGKKTPMHRQ